MSAMHKKLIVGGVILAGAIGYLAYAGVVAGKSYYMDVDAFVVANDFHAQRVRLRGTVAPEGIVRHDGGKGADFHIAGQKRTVPVSFNGPLPDMFKGGAEVVVTGKLDERGVFQATDLLTKCASKYTEKPASHGPQGPENQQ